MAEHTRDQSTENAEETLPTIEEMSGLIKTFSPPPDAEHTPGPWYASSYDGWEWEGHCIRDAHGQIIAKLALNVPGDANAYLIAAAPVRRCAARAQPGPDRPRRHAAGGVRGPVG